MLVYGDHTELVRPADRLAELIEGLSRIRSMPVGLPRHAALVSALIEAGRLEQAVSDRTFADKGHDGIDGSTGLSRLTFALAVNVFRSWRTGSADVGELPKPLAKLGLTDSAEMKLPEGYAFYGVYPEAFADAALRLKLRAPPRVIGIRSIGTSLGAIAAAAVGAGSAFSVRPFGNPFDRRIALSAELEAELLSGPAHYIIVDEGPGLSGSSFGAVADWLEARGVPLDRIAFITSHSGPPGPQTQERHRARWAQVQRVVADLGPKLGHLIGGWAADLLGPLDNAPSEISGGEWRRLLYKSEEEWPPVNPLWERRKFLLRSKGRLFVAKFAGLGITGESKLAIARRLNGFVPQPVGLVHGFIVERWLEDAQPLRPGEQPLQEVADYLGTRGCMLSESGPGASLSDLLAMVKRNASLALGSWAEQAAEHWSGRIAGLEQRNAPICIDGRVDRPEWLRSRDGKLTKTDALDHHAAHDLIGCQDLAWDVAAAAIEFDLSPAQTRWLAAESGRRAGRFVDPELLDFLTLAYLGFRLGQASMAVAMTAVVDAERWKQRIDRYAHELSARLRERLATRLTSFPQSVSHRNEPVREQSSRRRVDEEEEGLTPLNLS